MATACWWFIVVKSVPLKAAPALDFFSLQVTNIESYQHFINRARYAD
jgi:hypothetical protein